VPKLTVETTNGNQVSRSASAGRLADAATRTFRIVLNQPGEPFSIPQVCGINIGDRHPVFDTVFCNSITGSYEGDSRMVYVATFEYQSTPSSQGEQDRQEQPPDIRPANWTTSTSLMEVPVRVWSKRGIATWDAPEPAVNPVGDIYDGITALAPVVTISITQFNASDPTINLQYAGYVNAETITLGNLSMSRGTVLFRGVSYEPTVESWGPGVLYRGWKATYEFAYRRNTTTVRIGGADVEADIGWDIAVPVTGFNVRAFNPAGAAGDEDVFGQPLRHGEEGTDFDGRVEEPLALPKTVTAGDRVRAMVKVFAYKGGGASQLPSASPVALKLNGRPLKTHDANGNLINKPLVFAYQTQPSINFTNTLGIRLQ
jgi:hypothetical protein